jgi:hypothetical protein
MQIDSLQIADQVKQVEATNINQATSTAAHDAGHSELMRAPAGNHLPGLANAHSVDESTMRTKAKWAKEK